MLKKILLIIVLLVVVLVVVIALQPSQFHIERTATIAAKPPQVFPYINNLHLWEQWSPWAKMDPTAKQTYSGPEAGVDARVHWAGNSDVGEGSMTITESKPHERIVIRLDFIKPMVGTSMAIFTFKPEDANTVVNWRMEGENGFIGKAFSLFCNMDSMVGEQFEHGLNNIKTTVEKTEKVENVEKTATPTP